MPFGKKPRRIDRSSSKPIKKLSQWRLNGWHPCPIRNEKTPECPVHPKCSRVIFKIGKYWNRGRPVIDERTRKTPLPTNFPRPPAAIFPPPPPPPPPYGWGCAGNLNPYCSMRDNIIFFTCPRANSRLSVAEMKEYLPENYPVVQALIEKARALYGTDKPPAAISCEKICTAVIAKT